jgi:hypothetical protein
MLQRKNARHEAGLPHVGRSRCVRFARILAGARIFFLSYVVLSVSRITRRRLYPESTER